MEKERFIVDLNRIREMSPLVHNITNYVVMNNTANALLALGASPVMAHSIEEVADMASIASALVINIGTLEPAWVDSMILAARTAAGKGIPVVFDPVGAGATPYRSAVCKRIMEECRLSVIRGNASEIMALLNVSAVTKGVDSTVSSESALDSAMMLAKAAGAVVVISGAVDYITDGTSVETVTLGSPMMSRVTGMGCTATAITGAFAAVNSNYMEASVHAMTAMGLAGSIAAECSAGPGSLQVNFLDTLYALDAAMIEKRLQA